MDFIANEKTTHIIFFWNEDKIVAKSFKHKQQFVAVHGELKDQNDFNCMYLLVCGFFGTNAMESKNLQGRPKNTRKYWEWKNK